MSCKVEISGLNTSNLPKLKSKELMELMVKLQAGDEEARQLFILANMRLVLSIVQRFMKRKENPDDIFQVGCIGLLKAIKNFDISYNLQFSTYAVPMIVGEIKRFLRDGSSIRVSRSLRDIAYKALQAREKILREKKEEATIEEIAKEIDESVRKVTFALDAITEPVNLFEIIYSIGKNSILFMVKKKKNSNSSEEMLENFALKEALKKLTDRESEIVRLRYYIGKTQTEVSEELGISQAQVSRLEKNALNSIKKLL